MTFLLCSASLPLAVDVCVEAQACSLSLNLFLLPPKQKVLETQWKQFMERVEAAADLDAVIGAHDDFVVAVKDQMFLASTQAAQVGKWGRGDKGSRSGGTGNGRRRGKVGGGKGRAAHSVLARSVVWRAECLW